MYISSRSWHARVYKWWKEMKYGTEQWRAPKQVNLCPYVRAVLFWSWSRWLMRSGRINFGKGPYGRPKFSISVPMLFWSLQPLWLLYAEYLIFGRKVFMFTLGILGIAVGVLSALSVVGLIFWLMIKVFRAQPVQDAVDAAADGALGFGRVVKEYYKGTHNKICPAIEFREEQ